MKRITNILLSLMMLLSVCACGETQPWQEQYDLGVRYLSDGNYEEAILAFEAAIEIDPRQPEIYVGLADAWLGQGDFDMARQVIEQGRQAMDDDSVFDEVLKRIERAENPDAEIDGDYTIEKNGPEMRLSLTVPGLQASYPVNLPDTEVDEMEYCWGVNFEDGTNKFLVSTMYFRYDEAQTEQLSPAEMQNSLWLENEDGGTAIGDAVLSISGETMTWDFTIPEEYYLPGADYVVTGTEQYLAGDN